METRPVLYLIDGHALAYRSYFALQRGGFATSSGESTSAVYGFSRTLLDVYEHYQPKYLAVTFDEGLSAREEIYPEYKATRESMPDDLRSQFDRIRELVAAFNIPQLTMPNMEADDVLGTISRQAVELGLDVHIATGDRDILQLLGPHVRVQLPQRGEEDKVWDVPAFRAKWGLEPSQLVDLKAMMGDSSDNIPGVAGVGEKTATDLLKQYGDLDTIYENLDEIKTRPRNRLSAGREMAYLSRELATIKRDLDIELDLESCIGQDFELKPVDDVFSALEFRTLRERLHKVYGGLHGELAETGIVQAHEVVETIIVRDEAQLDELAAALNEAELIALDTETTSIDQMSAELVGISLAVDGERGFYVPVGHRVAGEQGQSDMFAQPVSELDQLPLDKVIAALRDPLENAAIPKTAHNAVYDLMILRRYGINVTPIAFDTMIAEWVNNPISKFLGLKALVAQTLDVRMTEISALLGTGKNQKSMAEVEIDEAAPYAAADAAMTLRLVEPLQHELQRERLDSLYSSLELPLIPIISEMQFKGVALDVEFLREMSGRLKTEIAVLEASITEAVGIGKFNIGSPKQLNLVLFDQLKLPTEGLKKTKLGFSTDAATLDALKDEHPIVNMIVNYRELSKLKSTYVDALPTLVNAGTGRVHTSYNQAGSATGRFSSNNPNLQNIPVRTEQGREVRRAFVAPAGYVLLAVDYSQIELRVMAHISEDETLIDAFHRELDIHQATAATVNGIDPEAVTYEQRNFAKRVNFGLMYGMGAFRLARDSDLTLAEAEDFISTYFERMPGVKEYIDRTKAFVWEHGYTETLYGRRRIYPAIRANGNRRSTAAEERAAINMPIQGTAADILKQSMIDLDGRLAKERYDAAMILQVHDELVLEVKEDQLDAVTALVVETMEAALPDGKALRVPLRANASFGLNWRDMDGE
ncbi:MAG: DNA polymerase I [Chloroflexota bacterium]|nr:DNA polymerase I [Chloroflexota bacterium]MDE2909975.1 DNA polymerase I [Chloroflexota bacterium]